MMKRILSVSNLCWLGYHDEEYFDLLLKNNVFHIEIAPAPLLGENFQSSNIQERLSLRKKIENKSLNVIGLQSVFFNKPHLQLVSSGLKGLEFIEFCQKIADLCSDLGGKSVVLGAPKNRIKGAIPYYEALSLAGKNLKEIGDYSIKKGIYFTIEALPESAGCDFIQNLQEAEELVALADSEGIRGHLDTGSASFETQRFTLPQKLSHVHINDFLMQKPTKNKNHEKWGKLIKEEYSGIVSIEMKSIELNNKDNLVSAIEFTKEMYI